LGVPFLTAVDLAAVVLAGAAAAAGTTLDLVGSFFVFISLVTFFNPWVTPSPLLRAANKAFESPAGLSATGAAADFGGGGPAGGAGPADDAGSAGAGRAAIVGGAADQRSRLSHAGWAAVDTHRFVLSAAAAD